MSKAPKWRVSDELWERVEPLLPKYRGASPVAAAILAGETETGVTVQRMARECDAGEWLCHAYGFGIACI